MKKSALLSVAFFFSSFTCLTLISPLSAVAQLKYYSNNLIIAITGTASSDEWELKSEKGEMEAVFGMDRKDNITGLYTLWFTVEAQSLKGHRAAMENSAYKALKTKSYDNISFTLKSSVIKQIDDKTFQIKCTGYLSVAGAEQETELLVICKVNDDKSFTCSGSKKIKMSEFNVKAPTVAIGIIKADDDILITYNTTITRKA